ncbi:BlaI/MecI/CopY family transcriptional regulator [Aminipila sp.]|uniref:BlaI/MecI/CopY family transcriptional regulator n=1 Tax=Aminipila sp. TaxID=2060095 RepID=UPI0028A283D1|nr:BlaI/MecI/CopY family transcriptional regulator [Aminipila sp.]
MSKMNNMTSLTNREMDVMQILWESDRPLVASDITKINESLSTNTVQSVLRSLLKKNLIEVAEIVYSGTVLTRRYKPTVSKKDLVVNQFVDQFKKNENIIPIPHLVATLLKHEKNEKAVVKQLEQLLEERKKMLDKEEK